jgi:CelD/BcsL family acetyltransferase involved in cellulose biosynthesis
VTAILTAIVRDAATLRGLAEEWGELWRACPTATPFQSPEWLLPWWSAFGPGELLTIVCRADGRLVGLAPLYMEHGALGCRILPLGIGISDYLDVLAVPDHADAVPAAMTGAMQDVPGWQEWEFAELAPDALARRILARPGLAAEETRASTCPVLELPPSAKTLKDVVPARRWRHLSMSRNRAARRGNIEITCADASSAPDMLTELFRFSQRRREFLEEPSVFADERVQSFHLNAAPLLVAAGLARICRLRLGQQTAAVCYTFQRDHAVLLYALGFDLAFEFESPGTTLVAHVIETAMQEGRREVDFMRGAEPYKYTWGARDRWNLRRAIRRPAVYARAS